jgi:phosphoglycerol transferase MdoB-like AlkP superfamily enzyme
MGSGARQREWTRAYLIGLAGLILFWAVETFLLQGVLFLGAPPTTIHPIFYQCIRFGLDVLFLSALILLGSRPVLLLAVAAGFVISTVCLAYANYFHRSLSIFSIINNLREGAQVSGFGLKLISPIVWAELILAVVIKVFWIIRLTPQPGNYRKRAAAVCLSLVVVVFLGLQWTSFAFHSLRTMQSTRSVFVYGYVTTWMAELFYAQNPEELSRELMVLQKESPDRLASLECHWPVTNHVVVIQLESVGWNAVRAQKDGQDIMPFLRRVAEQARVYRVEAYHYQGSADMDYATLSGGVPLNRMIAYTLPDVTYSNSLAQFMHQNGFRSVALHGNRGSFFNRRPNYELMGFDQLLFSEEVGRLMSNRNSWGIPDRDILKLSSRLLNEAKQKEFHFIITLDSHAPFDLMPEAEKKIFPGSDDWRENYLNSMNYLDRQLEEYLTSLPTGTLVVLYGDHTAGVNFKYFTSDRVGAAEFVPCIVYRCGAPQLPQLEHTNSLPERLRTHDILNHLRREVVRCAGKATNSAASGVAHVSANGLR